MSYAPLDVHFDEHRKFARLELEHFGLMACALAYCNRVYSDGFVPDKAVRGFGASGKGAKVADRLVSEGIWERVDGGFSVVGYLEHNLSKAQIEEKRLAKAEAGAKGGKARSKPQAGAQAGASSVGTPRAEANEQADPKLSQITLSDSNLPRTNNARGAPEICSGLHPTGDLSLAAWARDVLETVRLTAGKAIPEDELTLEWAQFVTHLAKSPTLRPVTRDEWQAWVLGWVKRSRGTSTRATQRFGSQGTPVVSPELVAAYEAGITEGKGGAYAMPAGAEGELLRIVVTFGRTKKDGSERPAEKLPAWVKAAAFDFAEDIVKRPKDEARFYSAFAPKGCVKWLNEQERATEAQRTG